MFAVPGRQWLPQDTFAVDSASSVQHATFVALRLLKNFHLEGKKSWLPKVGKVYMHFDASSERHHKVLLLRKVDRYSFVLMATTNPYWNDLARAMKPNLQTAFGFKKAGCVAPIIVPSREIYPMWDPRTKDWKPNGSLLSKDELDGLCRDFWSDEVPFREAT